MKFHSMKKLAIGALLLIMPLPFSAAAVTPMEYFNSLVAGGDEPGFRDGAFSLARFNHPAGMAFDDKGNKLYVADSGNNRIRVIDLNRNNEVATVAGTGSAGALDGPLSKATFNVPTKLATLPDNRLAVFDSKNNLIRLVNLQNQTVSTLAKGIYASDMVYRPQDNSLYFSEWGKVAKMNMQSLAISDVISNNALVPAPGALCLYQENLCVADTHLPTIYEVKLDKSQASVMVSTSLTAVGNAKDVLALFSSNDFLYALQAGGSLLKVGLPDSSLVKFPTPWGFLFKNQDHPGILPLLNIQPGMPVGFLASPVESLKFFISGENSVVSVKDYDFEKFWTYTEMPNRPLSDFEYPAKKPARTFRILAVGASRNSAVLPVPSDPDISIVDQGYVNGPRVNNYSKQLEFLLNTESAIRNLNIHFEVLNLTHDGIALNSYAYYEVPDLVKKYDIDLVLGLVDLSGYVDYFMNPINAEGLPVKRRYYDDVDHEYIKKPLSERATAGAAADLIKRCKELKIPVSEKQDCPGDGFWSLFCTGDARLQNDLTEMAGRRLQLLRDNLNSMKTSEGNCPQLVLFYVPGASYPNDCLASFWNDVCNRYNLKYLDLSESYDALRASYYPAAGSIHNTIYGNELIARLLSYYLPRENLIPIK